MPVLDTSDTKKVQQYQAFIASAKHTAITQDYAWQQVKSNWTPLFVYLEEAGEMIAAMSILMIDVKGKKDQLLMSFR